MPTDVMLDDLQLPLLQEMRVREDRALVAHPVPGLDGAAHQQMGRRPTVISLVGFMADAASLAALEKLRRKFQAHDPVPFTADITTATQVQQVIIDDLHVTEMAGKPQQYRYVMRLFEYIPPPPPVAPLQAPGVEAAAGGIFDQVTGVLGELPGLGGLLDLNLVNPAEPLEQVLDGFKTTAEQIGSALGGLDALLGD